MEIVDAEMWQRSRQRDMQETGAQRLEYDWWVPSLNGMRMLGSCGPCSGHTRRLNALACNVACEWVPSIGGWWGT